MKDCSNLNMWMTPNEKKRPTDCSCRRIMTLEGKKEEMVQSKTLAIEFRLPTSNIKVSTSSRMSASVSKIPSFEASIRRSRKAKRFLADKVKEEY